MHRRPPTSTLFPYTTLFRSMTLHAPQLITAARMLYAVWLPADPAAAAELVPDGLTAREGAPVFMNQYVVDRKSTRLNSSHVEISYAVFCLKKKINNTQHIRS